MVRDRVLESERGSEQERWREAAEREQKNKILELVIKQNSQTCFQSAMLNYDFGS